MSLGECHELAGKCPQPLACVIEEVVLGELNRGYKGKRVHGDIISALSSLPPHISSSASHVWFPETSPSFSATTWLVPWPPFFCCSCCSNCGRVIASSRMSTFQEKQRKYISSLFFSMVWTFCPCFVTDHRDLMWAQEDGDKKTISRSSELIFFSYITVLYLAVILSCLAHNSCSATFVKLLKIINFCGLFTMCCPLFLSACYELAHLI